MRHYRHSSGLEIIEGVKFFFKNNQYPANWWKSTGPENLKKMGFELIPTPPRPKPEPLDPLTIPLDRRKLRRGLLALNVTGDQVVAAIKEEPDAVKRELAMIDWEDAASFHYDHPLVALLMARLGLSEADASAKWAEMAGVE